MNGSFRVGHGYDVHRLTEGRLLILGGVQIPYEKGLMGHSDADVLVHAILDALLGAANLGDIGRHFSDQDPQYLGISSLVLAKKTADVLRENGYEIGNIDATLIAQQPKLMAYIPQMCQNISQALSCSAADVSVKATTEEHLGFTGTGEGIAAHALCLLRKIQE